MTRDQTSCHTDAAIHYALNPQKPKSRRFAPAAFVKPSTVMVGLKRWAATQRACNHRNDKQSDEHKEQDLWNTRRCARNAAKAKGSGDKRYNKKSKGPAKHGNLR